MGGLSGVAGSVLFVKATESTSSSVTVINHGTDIAEDMLPRLFDRFFRVDKSRSQPGSDGAGLGLAITRAIMEAHGGSIEVASRGGVTSFTLKFPTSSTPMEV